MKRIAVVVPAGGSGRRMGGAVKPLLELAGTPLLERALAPFLARPDVRHVVVALPAMHAAAPPAWLERDPRVRVIAGGAERGDSVRLAVGAVPDDVDIIVVHDAARPFVSAIVIDRCLAAVTDTQSAIAAVPVTDTIQEVDSSGRIVRTPDRHGLRAAQTPQAFPAAVLRRAHARAAAERITATDDAALVARYGGTVVVVDGTPDNIKVTTPADLAAAEVMLATERVVQ